MFTHEGVAIRQIEVDDLAWIAQLRNHSWEFLGDIRMVSMAEQREWFDQYRRDPSRRYFAFLDATRNGPPLGIVRMSSVDHVNQSVCVGGDIVAEFRGRGHGHRMYSLIKRYCFDYMNMNRLWLLCLETNTRALHIYEKAGFTVEGRQRQGVFRGGRRVDQIQMSILASEYRAGAP